LREVADGADDIFIAVDAERKNGYEAEGKPGIPFNDMRGVVALENS